jgi:hypothetical protein
MAVAHSWPLASDISHLARLDNHDAPSLIWTIAWDAHALAADPLHLFDATAFYPEHHTLAFSEHMLVPAMMGAPLMWGGVSPVTVYNILIIAGLALSAWSMCIVMERWTGSAWAGIIAGLLYGFNAHVLTRFVHLQAQHVEFFPIALLALDRVIVEARRRDAWVLAGTFVLQALCSNYLLVFCGYALVVATAVRWRELNARAIRALALAAAISAVALAPFLLPYYLVDREYGLARSADVAANYDATWNEYLATGARLHFEWWSQRFYDGRGAFFPGFTALALALVAVVTRWRDRRVHMALAIGALGLAFSFGTSLPGYRWLHAALPLLDGLRNVSRWGWLPLASVAVLAGFGAASLQNRAGARWTLIAVGLCVMVTAESMRTPVGFTPFHGISAIYDRIASEPHAIVAEFPFFSAASISGNGPYMLANTRYFKPMVNGYSSLEPAAFEARGRILKTFPSDDAFAEMHRLGVTHFFVHDDSAVPERPDLDLIAEEDGIRLYRLR